MGTPFLVQNLIKLWNEKAPPEFSGVDLPFKRPSEEIKKIQDALKRNPNGDWWGRVISRLHDLPFVKGTNDRGGKITLDVMVRDAEKILDGKYGGGLGEGKAVPRLKAALKEADPFCAACKGTGVVENVSSGGTGTLKCAPRPPPGKTNLRPSGPLTAPPRPANSHPKEREGG